MKSQTLRVWALGTAIGSLVLCGGDKENNAKAEAPASASAARTNMPPALKPEGPSAAPAQPETRLVQPAESPQSLKVSPALSEIIKLAQAGVSEDVMLAYVTNSARLYNISSDEIVYLNDLGVSSEVVTALIQQDSAPGSTGMNNAATGATSLPPGVALTTPATDVYPGTPYAPAGENAAVSPPPAPGEAIAGNEYPEQPGNAAYFYDSLAPYGNWINVDGYGLCWQPTVAVVNSYWRPYGDRGRWLWSDCGWYWYSDYSWGWAPFHYGRWCSYPNFGWFWVPDRCWGPSWVSWRCTDSFCGWAPLPPSACFVSGFGFFFGGSAVGIGFDFGIHSSCFTFIPLNRFCDRNPGLHSVPSAQALAIFKESTVVNNMCAGNHGTIINNGIAHEKIAKATHGAIPKVVIRETQLLADRTVRPERLEGAGSSQVIVRPRLPDQAPATPIKLAIKSSGSFGLNTVSGKKVATPPALLSPRPASPNPERLFTGSRAIAPLANQPPTANAGPRIADAGAAQARAVPAVPLTRTAPSRPILIRPPNAPQAAQPRFDAPSPVNNLARTTPSGARPDVFRVYPGPSPNASVSPNQGSSAPPSGPHYGVSGPHFAGTPVYPAAPSEPMHVPMARPEPIQPHYSAPAPVPSAPAPAPAPSSHSYSRGGNERGNR
jgi:hypothetical protein